METAAEVREHLKALDDAVWELAALRLVFGDPAGTTADERAAAERVLIEAGLMVPSEGGAEPSPGLHAVINGGASDLASEAAGDLIHAAGLLVGVKEWGRQDDEGILARGRASAQFAGPFEQFVLPAMDGLGDLLGAPGSVMLDVGVGIAGLAVAFCRVFPNLRVVGLDVLPRALDLARRTVEEAGVADRIELRLQDVSELEDSDAFCLAWLPAPFLSRRAIEAAIPRISVALVPGGWILVGHDKLSPSGLSTALTRFRTLMFGGTALGEEEARQLLRAVDLECVATLPTPDGAPGLTVGRRRRDDAVSTR